MPNSRDPGSSPSYALLRALSMPFQLASLLFVAISSPLLAIMAQIPILAIAGLWIMLVLITHYALQLIDDAANGELEARPLSAEMANPFSDARALVHPALATGLGVLLLYYPGLRLPVLLATAAIFPASLGACALSGRALHAFHPGEMLRVVRGLGPWYPLVVLFCIACGLLGVLLSGRMGWLALEIAAQLLLLLLVYAGIGGALFHRRHELNFEPRLGPERRADEAHARQLAALQQFIDGLYADLRARESVRALDKATDWLQRADPVERSRTVDALLHAGTSWDEPREYPRLLRGLVPAMLRMQQPALALQLAEACLQASPTFCTDSEADTVSLASHALHTGRRRVAARLLANYLQGKAGTAPHGAALQALRARLLADAPAQPSDQRSESVAISPE